MSQRGLPLPGSGWRGFTLQMFLFTVLPLTVLLLAIAFGSLSLHHESMRTLVGDRDLRAVRSAANGLSRELDFRAKSLHLLAAQAVQTPDITAFLDENTLPGFDAGLALVDSSGRILAGSLDGLDSVPLDSLGARQIPIEDGVGSNANAVHFAQPIRREDGSWIILVISPSRTTGQMVGGFTAASLARSTLSGVATPQSSVLLVAPGGIVLHQIGQLDLTRPVADLPGVYEVLRGESGVNYTEGKDHAGMPEHFGEHVVAFSPVEPLGWGLVIEEPWESSAGPLLQATQFAPLVLAPVLILAIVALWFGARQIVQPLQALERRAAALAAGDFQAIQTEVGGIGEIRRLQDALVDTARALHAAQESLHGYIGALTTGVEAERRSLARELHDDTLQSLIALNQQVQMTQLRAADSAQRQPLVELQSRVGQTIINLRRAIGGLRPIYLEDLGLSAALGMLSSETESRSSSVQIVYTLNGSERRLPAEGELALYRIAQAALNNAVYHAKAGQVNLMLDFNLTGAVTLSVADNGQGFVVPGDPSAFAHHGHYGLLGMRERAELVGAAFTIESAPGKGTIVKVRLDSSPDMK